MRKLEPSMMTVSAWWRRRSRTAEVMVESPLKMEDHCLKIGVDPVFEPAGA
jgi:hypothetical protein